MFVDDQNNGEEIDPVQHSGAIILDIETTDTQTTVNTIENIVQPNLHIGQGGELTIETVIVSKDPDIKISVQPSVTDKIVDVVTTTDEDTNEDGTYTTKIKSVVTLEELLNLQIFSNTSSNKTQQLQEPSYRYIIIRHSVVDGLLHGNPGGDPNMTCQEMYSLMNLICVKMSEGLYQTLRQNWPAVEVIELQEQEAFYGTQFFGEIRKIAKLWEAKTPWYGEKVPTEMTPEIVGYILKVMKIFAREIVEQEFERRWLTMRNASAIEAESWRIQQEEAKEWLEYNGKNGHKTPFLDYLAEEKQLDKTELAEKILEKAEQYQDRLAVMLVQMQKILKEFESCSSVWDINVLYEDYLGIGMPIKQAIELGRCVDGETYQRKPEWSIKGNGYYF